jgi:hypothetical protein
MRANPQGGQYRWGKGARDVVEIGAKEVPLEITRLERELNQHIPARRKWLERKGELEQAAVQEFPQLEQADHPFTVDVNAIIESFPQIKLLPSYRMVAAWTAVGRALSGLYTGKQLVEKTLEQLYALKDKPKQDGAQGARVQASPQAAAGQVAKPAVVKPVPTRSRMDAPPRASVAGSRPTGGAATRGQQAVPQERQGRLSQREVKEMMRGRFA